MIEDNIDYWKCWRCGFRVAAIEMKLLKFEPTCRCGVLFRDFTSVLKRDEEATQ